MTRHILITTALLMLAGVTTAAPVVYTDEALYLADLAALGGSTVRESFEDDVVWADSRTTISNPGSTPTVSSQGLVWTSNYLQNSLATGTVGGDAPDGAFALFSLPHGMTTDSGLYCDSAEDPDIPIECFQNDGLKVRSEAGEALYAFGGRIDTANSGKVTFLLDGVDINGNDTDNIDNWQREGDAADNWAFVGVIDTDGFLSVELRELRGKDFQQVLLFTDDFTIQTSDPGPPCNNGLDDDGDGGVDFDPLTAADPLQGTGDPGCRDADWPVEDPQCQDGLNNDGDGLIDFDGGQSIWGACTGSPDGCPAEVSDPDGDGVADPDPQCVGRPWKNRERPNRCGLGFELALLLPAAMWLRSRRRRLTA